LNNKKQHQFIQTKEGDVSLTQMGHMELSVIYSRGIPTKFGQNMKVYLLLNQNLFLREFIQGVHRGYQQYNSMRISPKTNDLNSYAFCPVTNQLYPNTK
jgi:hypothetical protein